MTLTKKQLIDAISLDAGINKKQSNQVINGLIDYITNNLKNNEDAVLSGFGKFSVKVRKERIGRNPATGEEMTIPEKRVVVFKSYNRLRDELNDNEETVSLVKETPKVTETVISSVTTKEEETSPKKSRISKIFKNAFGFLNSSSK